ncbi:MAG: hypothetical protein V3574_01145, partial [Candidatus Moraniibacteriota bacterium]
MNTREIATLLNLQESTIIFYLTKTIPPLKTPAEARELYENCPESMEPAVIKKWEELIKEAIPP